MTKKYTYDTVDTQSVLHRVKGGVEQCGGNFYYKKLHEKKELQEKIMKMKTKKMLVVVILSLIMAVTSIVPAFAYEMIQWQRTISQLKKKM